MSHFEANSYSQRWFELFHAGIPQYRTTEEVGFICAAAPLPGFRKVLDVCCGMGRHARCLCERGYSVTGVERDAAAVAKARELAGGPDYFQADVRNYQPTRGAFDLAILISQSFGYFDAATNREVLAQLAAGVRDGGRILLDLWNPNFFAVRQGERDFELPGGIVREHKRVEDGRLFVELTYPGGDGETFEWELFTPAEMRAAAEWVGLGLMIACTDFEVGTKPKSESPRIQFVLEKVESRK
jgi:SAM-dependent methyltransferase